MALPINVLQSLISRNRKVITGQHELVFFWKNVVENNPTDGGYVNYCLKQADIISKDIAKLVLAQRCLKRELGAQILLKRRELFCRKAKMTAMADSGEI